MAVIFGRYLDLQVDTIRILHDPPNVSLRVAFDCTKSLRKEPNEATIKIYNLSPDHRSQLTKVAQPAVSLVAGYKEEHTALFLGQAVHVHHERYGPDIITTVSTTDSGHQFQTGRIHKSFGPRTKAGDVLKALAASLGVKPGNLSSAVAKLNSGKAADVYIEGVTLAGHTAHHLDMLCRSAGLEWSIQEGKLQFLDVGQALGTIAIRLDETNMTTTPSVSAGDIVEGQTFIQSDFLPGRQVQIAAEFVTTAARLEKCHYTGDTHADEWFVDFQAKGAKALKAGTK